MVKIVGVTDPAKIMGIPLANIARMMGTGGFVVETHDGASFWPTYPGLIALDGSAAIRFEGVDISPFAGVAGSSTPYRIDLYDSSLELLSGYLAEADAVLGGAELITGDDSDLDTIGNWVAGNANSEVTSVAGGSPGNALQIKNTSGGNATTISRLTFGSTLTQGKLYKFQLNAIDSQNWTLRIQNGAAGNVQNVNVGLISGVNTFYFVAEQTDSTVLNVQALLGAGVSKLLDTFLLDEVTALGTDGCHVVSAKNGATSNWASQEDGFDYNDATGYTFNITST